jgi:signal transduction histidine kinase
MRTLRRLRRPASGASRRSSAQRRAQQLRLLQEVSHQIAVALEVQTVLERLVQAIRRTKGYPHVSAALIEGDKLVFRPTGTASVAPRRGEAIALPLDGPGLTTWAVRHAEPVLVDDVTVDPRYLLVEELAMMRSELTVPLIGRGGVIGVIDLKSDRTSAFDRHDLNLMRTLADHAATAIENARLYQVEQERRRDLETLQRIALRLSSDLDLDTVLRTVAEGAAGALSANAAAILMPDPTSDNLNVRAQHGLPDIYVDRLRIPGREVDQLIERWGSGNILELPHSAGDQTITADASSQAGFASMIVGRLMVEGTFIGVLCVYSCEPRHFTEAERQMLGALGQQAALAISNARRYQHERLLVADLEHSYNEMLHTLTELQRTQEQLERTARLRALGELASGVAHDFNNLLSGILGNSQLLLIDEIDPDRREMLNVIEQAAHDGAAMVRRIQEFARQREERTRELVDLEAVVDSALAITRTRWHDLAVRDGRPIRVRRDIRRQALVLGSPAELREMLVNLIINAIDAMPRGGELTLRLDERPEPAPADRRLAAIEVGDTGVGIAPELRQRIFDSFYTTKLAGQGSGLGLAICQNIANLHGGRIELESAVGVGTTFRVLLPLDEETSVVSAAPAPPTAVSACRVLVVDDEAAVRDVLARILRRAGHEVTVAASGEQALELFIPGQYDLLFTDLGMPGMGGAALMAQLRAHDPRLIAVVITGWSQHEYSGETLPAAAAVVAKPFTSSQITELVGELIGARAV